MKNSVYSTKEINEMLTGEKISSRNIIRKKYDASVDELGKCPRNKREFTDPTYFEHFLKRF